MASLNALMMHENSTVVMQHVGEGEGTSWVASVLKRKPIKGAKQDRHSCREL